MKYLLWSTPKETVSEEFEQCNAPKFQHPNYIKIKVYPLKRIYLGDRFIPCRRGYNFDMARYLLMKDEMIDEENTHTVDVCKQVQICKMLSQSQLRNRILILLKK